MSFRGTSLWAALFISLLSYIICGNCLNPVHSLSLCWKHTNRTCKTVRTSSFFPLALTNAIMFFCYALQQRSYNPIDLTLNFFFGVCSYTVYSMLLARPLVHVAGCSCVPWCLFSTTAWNTDRVSSSSFFCAAFFAFIFVHGRNASRHLLNYCFPDLMLKAVLAVMSCQVSWLSCAIFFLPAAYFCLVPGPYPRSAGIAQYDGVPFQGEDGACWMQNIAHRFVLQPKNLAVNSGWEESGAKLIFATACK